MPRIHMTEFVPGATYTHGRVCPRCHVYTWQSLSQVPRIHMAEFVPGATYTHGRVCPRCHVYTWQSLSQVPRIHMTEFVPGATCQESKITGFLDYDVLKNFPIYVTSGKHVRAIYSPLNPTIEKTTTGVCRGIHKFLIFDPKHTLWALVRTASARRF